jgi:peptide/nickel transport system permease protein
MFRFGALNLVYRLVQLLAVLFTVAVVTFLIEAAIPGDPAQIRVGERQDLTVAQRNALVNEVRHDLGLDKPLPIQFSIWLSHAVRLDFGNTDYNISVRSTVLDRLGPSLEIALVSAGFSFPTALLLATFSARPRRRRLRQVLNTLIITGFVVPPFWIAILLVLLFAVWLHWLPGSGYVPFSQDPGDHIKHSILPALTLAVPQITLYFRYMQQSMREAVESQYVKAARARGLGETALMYRHVVPNGLLPAITILGMYLGTLIGGVVVVEAIFGWPGIGELLLYAIGREDYNTMVAIILATACFYVVLSTLIDIVYMYLDPRIRRAA